MADYAKFKVAELQAQLKERSLPHTGKKDELIARLSEDDQKKTSAGDAAAPPAAAAPEDEIDWEEDEAAQSAAPATATASAPVTEVPTTEIAAPEATTETTEAPATTTPPTTEAPAPEPIKAPSPPSEEQIDAALAARLARIDKFVNKADPEDVARAEEEKASLLRLAKFKDAENSTQITNPKGLLDGALPEKRQKRGRAGGDDAGRGDRGGKRRQVGGGRGGGGGGSGAPRAQRTEVRNGGGGGGATSWMNEKDREAAKRRAERFAKPTA